MYQILYHSPLGSLILKADEFSLLSISFDEELVGQSYTNDILKETVIQLDEYFSRKRIQFNLPLAPKGTDFQQSVWKQLSTISYGWQVSYLQLARSMNHVLAIRAIANANGKNPIPIIIPCHRVVGSKGELTGFSGGLWRKQFLLEHEGNTLF